MCMGSGGVALRVLSVCMRGREVAFRWLSMCMGSTQGAECVVCMRGGEMALRVLSVCMWGAVLSVYNNEWLAFGWTKCQWAAAIATK